MFRLLRNFSLAAAVAIAVITAGTVAAFLTYQTGSLSRLSHHHNTALAHTLANALWSGHGETLRTVTAANARSQIETAAYKALTADVKALTRNVPVLKIKIYAPDGLTLYSTDSDQIGSMTESPRLVERALRSGSSAGAIGYRKHFESINGPRADIYYAETYAVISDAGGTAVAIVEAYTDLTPRVAEVRRDVLWVSLFTAGAFGVLYLILLFIVRRADGIMKRQYAELDSAMALLETRVLERTADVESAMGSVTQANERLTIEVAERERVGRELDEKRQRLLAQQYALTDLIRNGTVGKSDPGKAIQVLTEVAAQTLEVERVSVWRLTPERDAIECLDLNDRTLGTHASGVVLHARDFPDYFRALSGGEPIVADDALRHLATVEFAENYLRPKDIRSMLDVPIMRGGRLDGVLCSEKTGSPIKWTSEQQVFATTIANLVSLVLESREREKAVAENEWRTAGLLLHNKTLGDIMQDEAFRSGNIAEAMRILLRNAAASVGTERTGIWLLADDQKTVRHGEVFVAGSGQFESPAWTGETWYADALKQHAGKRIVANDDVDEVKSIGALYERVHVPLGCRSVLYAPISVNGRLCGFITCATTTHTINWTADHLLFVAGLTNLAALAIERNERERIDRELRAANEHLEAATRAKSEFLANMSHEIRTPMNGVFGMTELLGRTELTSRQRRLVDTISQSAKTLLTIINDILDLSRIEAGKLELDERSFGLRPTMESIGELFAEEAQAKGIELTVFVDNNVPSFLIGDPGRLRQVCVNLIGNAVKFTSRGEVSVRVTHIAASASGPDRIGFVVRDTGIGIDAAVQQRLFGAFTQADSSISRRFGGTGLGLSISRHLVALMGGEIRLDSRVGIGTTISFELPARLGSGAECVPPDRALLSGKRILVADDRATNREIVMTYLSGCGAIVVEAESGVRALGILEAGARSGEAFDLALLDVVMPDMNGIELLANIRERREIASTRVVLLTSLSWKDETRLLKKLRVEAMLSKPIRQGELLDEVARALAPQLPRVAEDPAPRPLTQNRWPGTRVLLVEDNPVNIEVAREFLEQFHCTVDIAHNGIEALAAFEQSTYAIVFMDVQMPEMDGITATRRIREREDRLALKATPIVGLTANAYDDDRSRCLGAGMNDHLSKPFNESQLAAAMKRWVSDGERSKAVAEPVTRTAYGAEHGAPAEPARSPINEQAISSLLDARPDLLRRMVRIYLDYAPKAVSGLRRALEASDLAGIKQAAHSLKSSSANVGGEALSILFKRLETAAKGQDLAQSAQLVPEIEQEFSRLRTALEDRFLTDAAPGKAAAAG